MPHHGRGGTVGPFAGSRLQTAIIKRSISCHFGAATPETPFTRGRRLDALAAEGCLKTYTDKATGTKADQPQWNACLDDLRPGDTPVIWKIDRLGRNLADLIAIVTTLADRGVAVRSLTNRIVDTTTAHGKLVLGMFALNGQVRAGPDNREDPGRAPRGPGPRPPRWPETEDDPALVGKAEQMYDAKTFTMAEIAASAGVTPATKYRHIRTDKPVPSTPS